MKFIVVVLISQILLCFSVNGQNRRSLLRKNEKQKFSKVIKSLKKGFKKKPENIILFDVKAHLFINSNYKKFDTKTAYLSANTVDSLLKRKTFDEKVVKTLLKEEIDTDYSQKMIDSISYIAYQKDLEIDKVNRYNEHLIFYTKESNWISKKVIASRNSRAYKSAVLANTVSSFQNFIDSYPNATQLFDAIENRDKLAFGIAKVKNTVTSYQYFIDTYPDANQISKATQLRNKVAFDIAKKENTSASYKLFIDKYPNSIQYTQAFNLFELRQFEENTESGNWLSFKSFYEDFKSNSLHVNSIDSIFKIGNLNYLIKPIKFSLDNTNVSDSEKFNPRLKAYHKLFTISGEEDKIISFHNNYYMPTRNNIDLSIIDLYKSLDLDKKYNVSNKEDYENFIEKAAPMETAFVALQRMISPLVNQKKWEEVVVILEKNKLYFENFDQKINELIDLLKSEYDMSIKIKSISSNINTKNGDEYAPIISADNKKIFFCGKNRNDNVGGEDVFYANKYKGVWRKSKILNDLSKADKNDAPIGVSSDGNKLILFESGDIYKSEKIKNGWSEPNKLNNNINTKYWEGDAVLTSDGNHLIFVRSENIIQENSTKNSSENNDFSIESVPSAEDLVKKELLGDGIDASNISLSGSNKTMGVFTGAKKIDFPINNGIILCTGNAKVINNWNTNGGTSNLAGGGSDDDLNEIIKNTNLLTNDKSVIEFDFKPISSIVKFEYVFGSEEYPEYVCSNFNDVFGFLISGPKPGGGYYNKLNLANIPNTNIPISVNTLNGGSKGGSVNPNAKCDLKNSKYFINNPVGMNLYQITVDGFTKKLVASVKVIPNKKYHIKLAIADVSDNDYDSYVFLKKNSFSSPSLSVTGFNLPLVHGDKQINGDIMIASKNNDGEWSNPIPLSNTINTEYSERSPFLHPDMKTLYFSSDGHGGIGKLDLFVSKRLADSCWNCWSKPVNIGKEINSPESDWGYKISTDGKDAFFSKSNKKSLNQDIYKLKLPSHLRPDLVAEVSGKILDNNGAPIDANIRWEDLETGEIIGLSKSDPEDGSYFIVLPMGKIYGYYIEDGSYFPLSNNLDLRKTNKALSKKEDIKVFTFDEMINNGIAVPMNNLFFSPLKYNLLNLSKNELSRISKIIKKYDLKVEISGHTDNVGEDDENQILSEKRALSVKNYLISKGCDPNKLISVGYGESKPVDDNNTESGKSKNRRVELRFIEN